MASACVNNIGVPPENFPYGGWLSPRLSFSGSDDHHTSGSKSSDPNRNTDPEPDFEFRRLDGPVAMLPADQLFADGKLVPLNLPSIHSNTNNNKPSSPENFNPRRKIDSDLSSAADGSSISSSDPYLFSPKAPRCSSRWKELLGLKKLYQSANGTVSTKTTASASSSSSSSSKSMKLFLHRGASKTASFSSENAPLLTKDHSDCESLSISSSRLSLSSSSSGHDHEDLPRHSLDSEKPNPNPNPISLHRNPNHHSRIRMVKPRANSFDSKPGSSSGSDPYPTNRAGRSPIRKSESNTGACRGVSVDSPRLNSSGKIVFQSLERSSSSPSSFNNGGPRFKQRGMERSYSANVRVTPVLNVPVSSLRGSSKSGSVFGFGQLFGSPQKKEGTVGNNGGTSKARIRSDRN